jgi:hypothetical protein
LVELPVPIVEGACVPAGMLLGEVLGVFMLVLGVDGAMVCGGVDGLVLVCACANPAIPSAAVNATAAVRVRYIGVLLW